MLTPPMMFWSIISSSDWNNMPYWEREILVSFAKQCHPFFDYSSVFK